MHLFHIPQCSFIQNRALCDMDQVHSGIYELGQLGYKYDGSMQRYFRSMLVSEDNTRILLHLKLYVKSLFLYCFMKEVLHHPWWRHQMETSSASLAICAGNWGIHRSGEFPTQRPVTRSFDVFFDLPLNKRLNRQWWGWWFEMLSHTLWRHHNVCARLIQVLPQLNVSEHRPYRIMSRRWSDLFLTRRLDKPRMALEYSETCL